MRWGIFFNLEKVTKKFIKKLKSYFWEKNLQSFSKVILLAPSYKFWPISGLNPFEFPTWNLQNKNNSILKRLSIVSYVETIDLNNIIKVKSSLDVRRIGLANWPTF